MPTSFSFGKIKLGTGASGEETPAAPLESKQFRLVVLGDFSGRAKRGLRETSLAKLKPISVDRDNFDQVMARLNVELRILERSAGPHLALRFRELDDFRPDRLFAQAEIFTKLRELRRRLSDPSTFAEAAADMSSWAKAAPPRVDTLGSPTLHAPRSTLHAPPVAPENLLEEILGATPEQPPMPPLMPGGADWDQFLQNIVTAHLTPQEEPLQAELLEQVDAAASALMRALLQRPDFQALESAWRGLYFLVRRLDTDEQLKLFLLDVSKEELADDLTATDNLNSTGTYRLLVEQTVGTPGSQPWTLLVGNYTFGQERQDVELLGRLAKIARPAGAPFLAAASPQVLGCASPADTPDPDDWKNLDADSAELWSALRSLPEASYLGLVLPRFLLRLPYGKDTDPIETLGFEETAKDFRHESYLWGNPAIICAYLLGDSFNRHGWEMRSELLQDLDGLPLHVYLADDESCFKPCAEVVLTDRAVARIIDQGIMPLRSVEGSDQVHLAAFRSLARSATLAGRWR